MKVLTKESGLEKIEPHVQDVDLCDQLAAIM
jgi:hypothetical protein